MYSPLGESTSTIFSARGLRFLGGGRDTTLEPVPLELLMSPLVDTAVGPPGKESPLLFDLPIADAGNLSRATDSCFWHLDAAALPLTGVPLTLQSVTTSAVTISAAEPAGNPATRPSLDSPVGVDRPGAGTLPPGNRDELPSSRRFVSFFELLMLYLIPAMKRKPGDSPANHPTRLERFPRLSGRPSDGEDDTAERPQGEDRFTHLRSFVTLRRTSIGTPPG